MIATFTFSINSETQEAVFTGNIPIEEALQLLQRITLAELIRKGIATLEEERRQAKEETGPLPSESGEDSA